MGRWSASHRKTAIFGSLAFVPVAIVIGTMVGQKTIDQRNNNVGRAHRAHLILKQAGFAQSDPLTEIVVIQSKPLTVNSPAFRAVVGDVVKGVAPFDGTLHSLRSPLCHRDQVSRDGRTQPYSCSRSRSCCCWRRSAR
jgi:RND superfamily putative drug exporter